MVARSLLLCFTRSRKESWDCVKRGERGGERATRLHMRPLPLWLSSCPILRVGSGPAQSSLHGGCNKEGWVWVGLLPSPSGLEGFVVWLNLGGDLAVHGDLSAHQASHLQHLSTCLGNAGATRCVAAQHRVLSTQEPTPLRVRQQLAGKLGEGISRGGSPSVRSLAACLTQGGSHQDGRSL